MYIHTYVDDINDHEVPGFLDSEILLLHKSEIPDGMQLVTYFTIASSHPKHFTSH